MSKRRVRYKDLVVPLGALLTLYARVIEDLLTEGVDKLSCLSYIDQTRVNRLNDKTRGGRAFFCSAKNSLEIPIPAQV